ncbi:MAG: hypothetical protein JW891_08715 [Candidatus Lokiarchaeota archaeon]|nr:hypothetical protein [Candidatus Lokiarchaeota archaeon]
MGNNKGTVIAVIALILAIVSAGLVFYTTLMPKVSESPPATNARAYVLADISNLDEVSMHRVDFSSESYDPGNNFDLTEDSYRAPISGYYLIIGSIAFGGGIQDQDTFSAILSVNNSIAKVEYAHASIDDEWISVTVSDVVWLDAGILVRLVAFFDSSDNSDRTILGSSLAYHTSLTISLQ